jgi:hypothetical protein
MPGAWAQIVVEINGVKTNYAPQHGWHANSSFAGLANRAGCEVIRVCRKLRSGVQFKEFMEVIRVGSVT